MKKVIVTILFAAMTALVSFAQDADVLKAATEAYNQGAESLNIGDNAGALASFKTALSQATEAGEAGAEVVDNCKDIIPKLLLQIGKDQVKVGNFDAAISSLKDASDKAVEYGTNENIVEEVAKLIPGINMKKANALIKDKNFNGAIDILKEVVAADPTNGNALILLANCYNSIGQRAEAEANFLAAKENGQEKQASKALSSIYLKQCQAEIKAKNFKAALESAQKSYDFLPNANALKLGGNAALQLKDNEKAIELFTKYIEMSPNAKDYSQICYNIASIYQGMKNNAKAIEFYEKVSPADPTVGAFAAQQLAALKK